LLSPGCDVGDVLTTMRLASAGVAMWLLAAHPTWDIRRIAD